MTIIKAIVWLAFQASLLVSLLSVAALLAAIAYMAYMGDWWGDHQ